jgi:hypothetical protein
MEKAVKSARRVSRYSLAKTSETLSKALVRARGYRLVSAGLSFVHSRRLRRNGQWAAVALCKRAQRWVRGSCYDV